MWYVIGAVRHLPATGFAHALNLPYLCPPYLLNKSYKPNE